MKCIPLSWAPGMQGASGATGYYFFIFKKSRLASTTGQAVFMFLKLKKVKK